MIRINVYLNQTGSDYVADMLKVDVEDIRRAHMTIMAPLEKRLNVIQGYSSLLDDGFDVAAFENGMFNDSISMVRFLRKFMPIKLKKDGTKDCVYLNIPSDRDNKYFIWHADSKRLFDIHIDLIIDYTLGKVMFCKGIIFHMEETKIECPADNKTEPDYDKEQFVAQRSINAEYGSMCAEHVAEIKRFWEQAFENGDLTDDD